MEVNGIRLHVEMDGGPGPLVSALTGKFFPKLTIPLTIVPGTLTDEEIDALT